MVELDVIYTQLYSSKIATVIKTSSTNDEISRIFDNKAPELIKKKINHPDVVNTLPSCLKVVIIFIW